MIKATGGTLMLELGGGNPDNGKMPYSKSNLVAELRNMADFLDSGGPVGNAGHINNIKGVRLVVSYALAVDAPESTWAKMQEILDATAEETPVNQGSTEEEEGEAH